MTRQERTHYVYYFDSEDRQAVQTWLKTNKLHLYDVAIILNVSYGHLNKVVMGKRSASSLMVNTLRKMGVKFQKNHQNTIKEEKNGLV